MSKVSQALDKLFWKASSAGTVAKPGTGTSNIVCGDTKLQTKYCTIQISIINLYEWLSQHTQLLQKIHSGGEMPDLSPILLDQVHSG